MSKGYLLLKGKIIDVRANRGPGSFRQSGDAGRRGYKDSSFEMEFQYENLIGAGRLCGGEPCPTLSAESIWRAPFPSPPSAQIRAARGGVGLTCDGQMAHAQGIETVGPRYFRYDIDYVPIEDRRKGWQRNELQAGN